jgi:hypothetical protein
MHDLLEVVFVAVACITVSYLVEEALADVLRWLNGADRGEGLSRRTGRMDIGTF